MSLDNRLDFIKDIKNDYVDKMTALRKEFIELDNKIKDLFYIDEHKLFTTPNEAARRTLCLARTNLEIALQFTIKSLCILGEVK